METIDGRTSARLPLARTRLYRTEVNGTSSRGARSPTWMLFFGSVTSALPRPRRGHLQRHLDSSWSLLTPGIAPIARRKDARSLAVAQAHRKVSLAHRSSIARALPRAWGARDAGRWQQPIRALSRSLLCHRRIPDAHRRASSGPCRPCILVAASCLHPLCFSALSAAVVGIAPPTLPPARSARSGPRPSASLLNSANPLSRRRDISRCRRRRATARRSEVSPPRYLRSCSLTSPPAIAFRSSLPAAGLLGDGKRAREFRT